MKRILLLALLVACGLITTGSFRTNTNFAGSLPTAPALNGQEDASYILGRAQEFIAKAKSTSYQADFIIHARQNGAPVPLFPAEFRLSYSANLDKSLYEVTAPSIAVGSAILIHSRPTLVARNVRSKDLVRRVALRPTQDATLTEAEVADGCSGNVCSVDGQCGDCSTGEIQAVAYKPTAQKSSGTFQKLISTGAFDLPYLTDISSLNAEKVQQVTHKGAESSIMRFDRSVAQSFGLSDLLVTVRHRDGAPVAFDFVNAAGQTVKRVEVSYVGLELTELTAINYEQRLELNIMLKSIKSINRNVTLSDSMFTRENLYRIVSTRPITAD